MSRIETAEISIAAVEKVQDIQAKLTPLLKRRLTFDVEIGRALHVAEDGELIEISFVPVSSYGIRSKTTQWAWANPELQLPKAYGALLFRVLAEKTGFDEFQIAEPISFSKQESRCMLALVVAYANGCGLLSERYEDTIWSFLITDIQRNRDSTDADESIRHVLYQLLSQDAVEDFNNLRSRHSEVTLDLSGTDLRGNPQPWKGDLHLQAAFDQGYVSEHQHRNLDGINLSGCRLAGTNLREVSLRKASFEGSTLVEADFTRADLSNANLKNAFLNGSNFASANLDGVQFAEAEIGRTLFINVDLSNSSGLDSVHHSTTSEISFSTLVQSSFKLSEQFMRSAGVSIGLLDDLRRGQRFATTYATCFLSYSTKDSEFAQRLYYALIEAGVRVFWDRTDLVAGEYLEDELRKAIREHDRTIAILSDNSLQSYWLEREVKVALYHKRSGFTPIRLCDIPSIRSFVAEKEIVPDIVNTYAIVDFSGWHEPSEFERCRDLLLKSIRR